MRERVWGVVQIVVAVSLLRTATLVIDVFNQDECYIAVQAQTLNAGGELYLDVVDRKPPLVQHIYALVFGVVGSDSLIAVHVLAILWVAATALVLGAIMRRRGGPREGRWATWLFVFGSMALLPRDALAANFELWMLLPVCLAMWIGGRGHLVADLTAGVLVGVATFMKQPAAVTLVPLAYITWRSPTRWFGLFAIAIGSASVAALVVAAHGEQALAWAFFSVGGYIATPDLGYAAKMVFIWTGTFLVASGGVWWLVVRTARARGWRPDLDLWIWLVTAFVGVATGLRFLGHYHLQLLPPACALAAFAAAPLVDAQRRRVIAAVMAPALVCAGLAFVVPNQPGDPDFHRVARYVRERTQPTERMLVWGHFPEIYWAAERLPAIRFVHTGFLTGQSGARPIRPEDLTTATLGAWNAAFDDLTRHAPTYVIDLAPGAIRRAEHFPPERYPRFATWLANHYALETVIDDMHVYRRR